MSRYIDADTLYALADENPASPFKHALADLTDLGELMDEAIFLCPDVQEVKHGKWIETDQFLEELIYSCSVCKEAFVLIDGTPKDNLWNYCPYCGAKMMDGGKQE